MAAQEFIVEVPRERGAPWWVVGVLIAAALVEIVVAGRVPGVIVDSVSMATLFAIPVAVLGCLGWQLYQWRARQLTVAAALTSAVGATVSAQEAGAYIHAVEAIVTHFYPRDVREAPPVGLVPIRSLRGSRIRVEWRHPGYVARLEYAGER